MTTFIIAANKPLAKRTMNIEARQHLPQVGEKGVIVLTTTGDLSFHLKMNEYDRVIFVQAGEGMRGVWEHLVWQGKQQGIDMTEAWSIRLW